MKRLDVLVTVVLAAAVVWLLVVLGMFLSGQFDAEIGRLR